MRKAEIGQSYPIHFPIGALIRIVVLDANIRKSFLCRCVFQCLFYQFDQNAALLSLLCIFIVLDFPYK